MKSFRSRLTVWYIVAIAGTLVSSLLAGRWLLEKELIHGIDLLNAAEWQEISEKLEDSEKSLTGTIDPETLRDVARHIQIDTQLYFFQIQAGNKVLFQSANLRGTVLPPASPGVVNETVDGLSESGCLRLSHFQRNGLEIVIASSLQPTRNLLHSYDQVSLIMLGMIVILSVFFGYSLTRIAFAPISRIQKTADRIRVDNLSERIPGMGCNDEIGLLIRLLNQMFDRLEFSFQQLQGFAGKASHELKTPLSIIRLQSEKLLLHGNLAPEQEEAVQQQLEGIARLGTVIDKLLFLARSQAGVAQIHRQPTQVRAFVESFQDDAEVLCEDRGSRFTIAKNDEGMVPIDSPLIRQVLLNLISNALNAAPEGKEIRFISQVAQGVWRVAIEDEGPGIPPEKLEIIFDPFVREVGQDPNQAEAEAASPKDAESGTGLGLAISRNIVELHQGRIWAENRLPGPGLRVLFEIPFSPSK